MKWRIGRKLGRTVYRQVGPEPSDADPVIGMMDSVDLAQQAVGAVNDVGRLRTCAHTLDLVQRDWHERYHHEDSPDPYETCTHGHCPRVRETLAGTEEPGTIIRTIVLRYDRGKVEERLRAIYRDDPEHMGDVDEGVAELVESWTGEIMSHAEFVGSFTGENVVTPTLEQV